MPDSDTKPNGFLLVIGWATLATVFGLVTWAAMMVVAIAISGASTISVAIAGLVELMVFASVAALFVGLPVALVLTMLWCYFIARHWPQLDRTWSGLFLGTSALALIVSLVYLSLCIWAFRNDAPYLPTVIPYLQVSIALLPTVVAGLLLPRKVFKWLGPGTFAR